MMSRHNKKKYVNLISTNILWQYVPETKKPQVHEEICWYAGNSP